MLSCFALNFEVINEEGIDKKIECMQRVENMNILYLYLLNVILLKSLVYMNWLNN